VDYGLRQRREYLIWKTAMRIHERFLREGDEERLQ